MFTSFSLTRHFCYFHRGVSAGNLTGAKRDPLHYTRNLCFRAFQPPSFPAFNATLLPEALQTQDFTDRVELVSLACILSFARANTGSGTSWLILVDYSFRLLFIYRFFFFFFITSISTWRFAIPNLVIISFSKNSFAIVSCINLNF